MPKVLVNANQLNEWLKCVGQRDPIAFKSLYDAAAPNLFGFALRMLKKPELADEALQESFISIWNNADSYQSSLSAPLTWMMCIVRNKAIDIVRKHPDQVEIDDDAFEQDWLDTIEKIELDPLQSLEITQEAKALAVCMNGLESSHRQAVVLSFFHDLSHIEVADRLELPLGTAKTWIRRSIERLRLCLNTRGL